MLKEATIDALFGGEKFNSEGCKSWADEFTDNLTKELYMSSNGTIKVRIVGPVIKAKRIFVGANRTIEEISSDQVRALFSKGTLPDVPTLQKRNRSAWVEIVKISDKANWSKCLVANVILLNSYKDFEKNKMYYFVFSKTMVKDMINACNINHDFCLSGVSGNNVNVVRSGVGRRRVEHNVVIAPTQTFLQKEAIRNILQAGIKDPKEFYLGMNRHNLKRRKGFFYNFAKCDESSVLDKYMEPIQQIANYDEEDQEFDHISTNPDMIIDNGWEEAPIFHSIEIQ